MTQKEFDEAVKAVMTKASKDGWSYRQIEDYAQEAVAQWLEDNKGEGS